MTFRTRTAFRNLLIALSFFVAAVLQGCTGGSNGGGTPPPNTSAPSITSLSQPSGAVGTPVTITGTNFGMTQGTSTVTFSGTAAGTPTSWSATSIAVPVPTGATTGNVVVTVGGVASNGVSFTVTVPAPSITSLGQTSGAIGTAVTITGTNFGTTQGATSTVTFNGTAGTPTSWSATSIVVTVPTGATTGNVVVTVGGVASNGASFTVTVPAPSITSLSQTSGAIGTAVTITGTNFGTTQGTSTVTFNGTAGTPTSWSATSIAVPVPTGATTGNVVVTVGGVASNGVSFTVTVPPPSITSLSQTSGAVGTAVTITGTNFGTTQGTSTVTFNGTAGTPTSWSATSIAVPVPTGATTGNVVVTVGGVASGGVNFIVTTGSVPAITSSDTATGTIGVAFSYQIAATNSPTSFGAVGLPTGFTLNTVSGLISGTPTGAAFASSVTLTATNTNGTGSGPLTLTINSGGIGTPVSHMIQISNDADDGYYNSQNSTGWHSAPEFGAADLVGSSSGSTTAWVTGYRFPSVGANSGDAIQSAYLQLVSSSSFATNAACGTAPCSNNYTFRVYGVAQDDGSAFSGTAGNTPLDVPYTTAYTDYTSTGPGDAHGSCQGQNNGQNTCTHTIDVTNIVREITSRPGWTNASAMRFALVSTNSSPVNVYAGFEDFSGSASKAATLVVNPAVPTIVSSGAWGTGAHQTYPSSYTVGPFVYPGATTLLLFLGDYYNFYYTPIPQPTVSDSCGNTWGILAGPTDWAGITYDMRSTVYYVQNPISCPAGAAITVATTVQEPIFLHFIAVGGTNTANEPITSAITSPNPGTTTTTATSDSITLTQSGLLVSWIFGDADGGSTPGTGYVFAPQSGFTIDSNSTPNYLTTVFQSAPSAGSYQSQFSISPEDGWQVVIVGLQAP